MPTNAHSISSEESPQESPSKTNGVKRRSPLASVDSHNGDLFVNHNHATSDFKRQKYSKTLSTRTLSETLSASNGKVKIFPSLREHREQLPIARGRESLIRSIASNNVTIVLGETGSGKTTRMFRILLSRQLVHIPVYRASSIPARGWLLPWEDRRYATPTCCSDHSRHSRLE
ncbi:hypothetical protein EI94DRAFT_386235 [Lactarius quietus]|nr:hypothetical protein EI94DRAFT_386235 [Lactarius quietus]